MDWTTIVVAFIGALASGGGLGAVFHVKEARRTKKLENDKAVADEWKELYERTELKVAALSTKLDDVFQELGQERRNNAELSVRTARAEILRCTKTRCIERHPPFGDVDLPGTTQGVS